MNFIKGLHLVICPEVDNLPILHNKCIECPYNNAAASMIPGNSKILEYCRSPKLLLSIDSQIKELTDVKNIIIERGQEINIIGVVE